MSEKKLFLLPDLGEGLPDAEIVEWLVKVGDVVRLDEPLVSMETAKAVVEVPSPFSGKVTRLAGAAGDHVLGLFQGRFAVLVIGRLDHVLALRLTLGFVGRTGDVDLDRGADLGVQANRHFVDAQALDRRVQDDLRALDLAAFGLDGLGDVATGDRTVQVTGFTGLTDHDVGLAVDLVGDLLCFGLVLLVALLDGGAVEFERFEVGRGRATSLVARQQVVTSEAVLDGDDVADGAEVLDAFQQNDLHLTSPRTAGGPDSERA